MFCSRTRSVSLALLTATLLQGCGALSDALPDRRVDYKKGRVSAQPLELPPDITTAAIDPELQVPGRSLDGTARYSDYAGVVGQPTGGQRVTAATVLPQIDSVKQVRSGNQRWLAVEGDRRKVWDKVREFWAEQGFRLLEANPNAGLMVTSWKENRADLADDPITKAVSSVADFLYAAGTRDQYRVRLEIGADSQTTEIYVAHRGMAESTQEIPQTVGVEGSTWVQRPSDPDLEAEMLARIRAFLLQREVRQARAIAKGDLPDGPVALLTNDEKGDKQLRLSVDFSTAWRLTARALDRAGYVIEDRDRQRGLYFVRYDPPDLAEPEPKKKGWLSRLAFWRSDDPAPAKRSYPKYALGLEEAGESTWLVVKDAKDFERVRSRDADDLLADLEHQFN